MRMNTNLHTVASGDAATAEQAAAAARVFHECAAAAGDSVRPQFGFRMSGLYPVLHGSRPSIELSPKSRTLQSRALLEMIEAPGLRTMRVTR